MDKHGQNLKRERDGPSEEVKGGGNETEIRPTLVMKRVEKIMPAIMVSLSGPSGLRAK